MKKLNYINVEKELSRNEMKQIMAGSGDCGGNPFGHCAGDADCNSTCVCCPGSPTGNNSFCAQSQADC